MRVFYDFRLAKTAQRCHGCGAKFDGGGAAAIAVDSTLECKSHPKDTQETHPKTPTKGSCHRQVLFAKQN